VGCEGTAVTAGEGRDPRRDLPRALIQTILVIGAIYFLVQVVSMAIMPGLASSKTALADAAAVLFGSLGAGVLTLGAVFSIGGNLSSSILSAPRMSYALARDGSMPDWFAVIHPRYRTPANSVLFYGLLCLVLALSGTFIWLAVISTLVRLIAYMVCIAALPRLARHNEHPETAFRLPGGMAIPAVALLLCLWLVTHAPLASWLMTGLFFCVGTGIYAWTRRQAAVETGPPPA